MVEKERKEEEKAKDMATASTKEKEEEPTKEERKEEAKEEEEVTKEDSKARVEDLEVERPMLVYVIIAISLDTMKLTAGKSKEICKVATSGKHSKMIKRCTLQFFYYSAYISLYQKYKHFLTAVASQAKSHN